MDQATVQSSETRLSLTDVVCVLLTQAGKTLEFLTQGQGFRLNHNKICTFSRPIHWFQNLPIHNKYSISTILN